MTPPPAVSPKARPAERAARRAYVYLLRSRRDSRCYTGWTTDLQRRLAAHNTGLTPSTKARRPMELIGYEVYASPALAQARERVLKRSSRMWFYFQKRMQQIGPTGRRQVVG